MFELTCSNRLERLFEKMALRCQGLRPFTERVVIVPSHSLKVWLKEQMAAHPWMGTSLGCKVLLVEEALYTLKKPAGVRLPNLPELICEIEDRLSSIEEVKGWVTKGERRKYHLADEIARLFQKYGRHGSDGLKGWQKTLWDQLFTGVWTTPYELFSQPFIPGAKPIEVDVFGVTFLSKLEFSFLKKVAASYPVRVWHLSPCLHYWSDMASGKEKRRLLKKTPELEPFMEGMNPLLANLGKVGRHMAVRYGEEAFIEAYAVSSEVLKHHEYDLFEGAFETLEEPATTLAALQADLLFMAPSAQQGTLHLCDDTVTCHRLPSRLREVEWVRDLVLERLSKGETEILVMTPSIDLYRPLIERVFVDLPISIESSQDIDDDPLICLLEYYLSRRDSKDLLPLLSAFDFDTEEIATLQAWMGSDQIHQKGVDPLLLRFMRGSLEISLLDLVAKFEVFFRLIQTSEPEGEKSYGQWVSWLDTLLPSELPLVLSERPISYYTFVQLVRRHKALSQEKHWEHSLGQIRFASFTPQCVVPASCLILMGLSEEAFPRKPVQSRLDLSNCQDLPSRMDEDRMLFLEALLSARRCLFITWSRSENPSSVVQELIDYGIPVEKHPELPWDPAYFSHYKTFSELAWRAFQVEPDRVHAPLSFSPPVSSAPLAPLSLRELLQVIKDPLGYYRKEAGVAKEYEEELDSEMSDTLSGLEAWKVRKHILEGQATPYFNAETLESKLKRKGEEKIRSHLKPYLETIGEIWAEAVIPSADCPIHGMIPYATKEGVVFLGEKKYALQALPYLLFAKKNREARNKIYCLKDQKTLEFDSLPSWEAWLIYAHKAKSHPYPFSLDCLKAILKGDAQGLSKALKKQGIEHEPEILIDWYRKEAEILFGEVHEIL